jgi:imidazolonepropionase
MNQDPKTFAVHAKQLLTMPDEAPALREYDPSSDLATRDASLVGLIEDAGILVKHGKITWIGPWSQRPKDTKRPGFPIMDTGVATPGWVECHTHAVFAGSRAAEFRLRNAGKPYVEILEAGGGILNTVAATRHASLKELADSLVPRVYDFVRRGVTSLEIKSGYGLSLQDELKQLQAIHLISPEVPCELIPCLLAAHAIPPEYKDKREKYVDLICQEIIPATASQKLAAYCDVFCDRGAFTTQEARRILQTAIDHHLIPRIHADEIAPIGATDLAIELRCASADHLEHTPAHLFPLMAQANVVGVLMPMVNLFLHTTRQLADARQMLNQGMEIALSTDMNPGSAMTQDIGLMTSLGCLLYKLTPGEALRAVTLGAARALRRPDLGRLRVGQEANITMFDATSFDEIPYRVGSHLVEGVVSRGEFVYWTDADTVDEE